MLLKFTPITSSSNTDPRFSPSHLNLDLGEASESPAQTITVASPELPDTQERFSPQQPAPTLLSPQDEVDAFLMRCFLDVCNDQPDPKPNICQRMLPDTLTNKLLPATEQPCQTPSPSTPPVMACITTTPDPSFPSTRQPSPQQTRQLSNGQTCSNLPASAPILKDIEERPTGHVSPPGPPPFLPNAQVLSVKTPQHQLSPHFKHQPHSIPSASSAKLP